MQEEAHDVGANIRLVQHSQVSVVTEKARKDGRETGEDVLVNVKLLGIASDDGKVALLATSKKSQTA